VSNDPILAALAQLEFGLATMHGDVMERINRLQNSTDAKLDSIQNNVGFTPPRGYRTRDAHGNGT